LGGLLDFRVGGPQRLLRERLDHVLQRKDRNPNTQGALDLGLARDGVDPILKRCASGEVKALLLQGVELLRDPSHVDAIADVPFVAVMATHEGPELDRPDVVLPAAMWAEVDGTFTNFQRRVQRIRAAFPAPGDARPRWELAAELLRRCGGTLAATSARDVFARLAAAVPDYAGLDYRVLGSTGRALLLQGLAAAEART
jgi:predicted molibdopterin-dependent oxidoreductase YjgC